jgi:chromosomal replication initiator protein
LRRDFLIRTAVDKRVRNSLASDLERSWERILQRVAERVGTDELNQLIRRLRLVTITPAEVRLEAPNKLTLVCITDSYLGVLRESVAAAVGPRQVFIDLPVRDQGELFPDSVKRRGDRRAKHALLNPKYTFANFVVGASNQFAHAASKAVATQPGDHYNPLFIYGGVGLGKTHLVNAIGHEISDRQSLARIAYLSSDAFMNELISSLRRDRMGEFKERFRRVDVLILDDVQLLAGRERTQEEFFHTFNTLYDNRRQIILTSDKVPKDIPDLEERLRNRFEWGLIADIQPPDIETRVAILGKKAEVEGIPLAGDVALFLATNIASNVRELEGSLTRLGAYASLTRRPITVEFAREVLQNTLKPQQPTVTFEGILTAVCDHFTLRQIDIRSKRRSKNVAVPRQLAMYLCRRLLKASFPHIGDLFARDHSTVIHATIVTERRIKDDAAFQATVEQLERTIRGL